MHPRFVALAALLWLAMAGHASADKLVSVMTLLNESGDDAAALELTDALRAGARSQEGWHVNDTKMTLSQLGLVHDCDPTEPACLEVIAAAIDAGLILVGTLEPAGKGSLTVRLQLYERGTGFREDLARAEFEPEQTDYATLAMSLLRQLQPPEQTPAAGAGPRPAAATDVDEQPSEQEAPDMAAMNVSFPQAEGGSIAWLGYTLLGVGAASLGLVAYSWLKINEAQEDTTFVTYRELVGRSDPQVGDVCAEASAGNAHGANPEDVADVKRLCDQGELFNVLQYVFIGTAVVAGATGGIVLWQDGADSESASLTLQPQVARDALSVRARLRL